MMSTDSHHDADNPYASPTHSEQLAIDVPDQTIVDSRATKWRTMMAMPLVFALQGALLGALDEDGGPFLVVQVATSIAFLILAIVWCAADRAEHGLEPSKWFAFLVVFCPGLFVMVPVHFLQTRGIGGLVTTLVAALFLVGCALVWAFFLMVSLLIFSNV